MGVWGCGQKPQGPVPAFCDSNDPQVSLVSGESLTTQGIVHFTRKTRQRSYFRVERLQAIMWHRNVHE